MKRFNVSTISLIMVMIFFSIDGIAGQYIRITKIDVKSYYPRINIFIEIFPRNSNSSVFELSNFSIYEDDNRIREGITLESTQSDEEYLYLVFSIDSSKSISAKVLKNIKSLADDMVSMLGAKDKLAVYHFDDSVTLLNDFSRDKQLLVKNINNINRHGKKTLLYNAIFDSLMLLEKVGRLNRKIIVFTDGKDEGSTISEQSVIQLGQKSGIPIYFICLQKVENIQGMARISKLTGGKLICGSRHEDISGMYKTIFSLIKNRYKISYNTSLNRDGLKHKIEIRFNQSEISDRDSIYALFPASLKFTNWFSDNYHYILLISLLIIIALLIIIMITLIKENKLMRIKITSKDMGHNENSTSPASQGESNNIQRHDKIHEEPLEISEESYINAWVYHKIGSGIGNKFLITTDEVTIGRGIDNTIVINDEAISTHHAKIKNIDGVFHLFDLISERGTILNGKKLLRPKMLYDWDEITMGKSTLIFRGSKRPH